MEQNRTFKKFPLGRIILTNKVSVTLAPEEILEALSRHMQGDWGDISPSAKKGNDKALTAGGQLLSAYHSAANEKFYVCTEWDRSMTTILFSDEY